jgi:hypothetical protein
LHNSNFGYFILAAAGLAWAVFDCWRRRRYRDAMLASVLVCAAIIGAVVLVINEANSN